MVHRVLQLDKVAVVVLVPILQIASSAEGSVAMKYFSAVLENLAKKVVMDQFASFEKGNSMEISSSAVERKNMSHECSGSRGPWHNRRSAGIINSCPRSASKPSWI